MGWPALGLEGGQREVHSSSRNFVLRDGMGRTLTTGVLSPGVLGAQLQPLFSCLSLFISSFSPTRAAGSPFAELYVALTDVLLVDSGLSNSLDASLLSFIPDFDTCGHCRVAFKIEKFIMVRFTKKN